MAISFKKPLNKLKRGVSAVGKGISTAINSPVGQVATAPIKAITAPDRAIAKGAISLLKPKPVEQTPLTRLGQQGTGGTLQPGLSFQGAANPAVKTTGAQRQADIERAAGITSKLAGGAAKHTTPTLTGGASTTGGSSPIATFDFGAQTQPSSEFNLDALRTPTTGGDQQKQAPGQPLNQFSSDFNLKNLQNTQTDPLASLQENLNTRRLELLKFMSPSDAESQLQDELTSFQESARLGISGLEGQGRGIPLGLVRGQQAKLGEQAEIKEQTLLDRLSAATAQRQASLQGAQLGAQFAESDLERAQQQDQQRQQMAFQQQQFAAQQQSQNRPFEFNGNLVQFDPATGQLKTVAEGATVQPGTDDMQEYQYATQTGFNGSFLDYLQQKSGGGASGDGFSLTPGQTRYDAYGNVIASAPGGGAVNATEGERSAA